MLMENWKTSLLKYYNYRRPIGNPSETEMLNRRPIGDLNMLRRRPIGDRHYPLETHGRQTYLVGD